MNKENFMYAITGATGNVGKVVASTLLEAGKHVRIISRDAEKAKELTDKKAELFLGDTTNVDLLKKAFDGVTAVFAMTPPDYHAEDFVAFQLTHVNAIAEALKACNINYVVSLSSQGAHLESGSGVVSALHEMEKTFDSVEGLNTLHLRPCYFMENALGTIGFIKEAGIMGTPIKGDLSIPIIATKDIGNYATKRLLSLDFNGNNIQDLLGARNVTFREIAKVFGAAIDKPDLAYVDLSYEDFKQALVGQKIASENLANNMNELFRGINEGRINIGKRNAESTTPTTIEEFAQTFKYVYAMS